ncbi:hypothetical protein C923_02128 [Plasmodium falciparum UGT5.1]|uniref:Uncharacterized protein n=1 Tax=Plasmodium falciparum UGT5.1 TaxID=1237627 RepID=W7JE21_PLAFA|nr:hypothetical protein C923_02128 [Plasmodium falciparum UGT5.1]
MKVYLIVIFILQTIYYYIKNTIKKNYYILYFFFSLNLNIKFVLLFSKNLYLYYDIFYICTYNVLLLSCLSSPVVRYVIFPCENVGSTPLADNFLRKVTDRATELPGGGRRNFFIKFLYNLL